MTVMTNADWRAEGTRRFGDDIQQWQFECASCGNIATPADFKTLGADGRRAPFDCIGRVLKEIEPERKIDGNSQPCNWTTGGLFRLSSLWEVEAKNGQPSLVFPFADAPVAVTWHA
ncbi:VVA0879 family protein [Nonomuraea sp. NPDC004580]|uniref:VVA0879 family protein n=1 Tax=Nonomuraea sp. NPDC004580 TaxID=3154552 RepID=UPI00339E37D4